MIVLLNELIKTLSLIVFLSIYVKFGLFYKMLNPKWILLIRKILVLFKEVNQTLYITVSSSVR